METTAKEGAIGKEKRGTSPSNPHTKKAVKSSSPSSDHRTSLASSEKPVPNYLKPTLSSRCETTQLSKRPSTDSSAQKPTLDRRRSFDKPPSPVHIQKALHGNPISPHEKPIRSASLITSMRNPPFSSRSISERLLKTPKDSKTDSPVAKFKSIKRSTVSSSKKAADINAGSRTKKTSESVTSESSIEVHDKDLGIDHVASEEVTAHDYEVQPFPDISVIPGNEVQFSDANVETELKNAEEETMTSEEGQDERDGHMGSDQVDQGAQEASEAHENQQWKDYDRGKEGSFGKCPEESIEKLADREAKTEAQEDKEAQENTAATEQNAFNEEMKEGLIDSENKEEELGEETNKGGEERERAVDQAKPEAQNVTAVKHQQKSAGKEAQVYNNVIEETASKLMENRKNKVRALAGAFETVISLQETK
ncbi:hypothetical protein Nepgr_014240 [Nepenthes gracilis]|uniref:Calmodulin-binding domain-containing protein n=1 Tax=Nepenthes gracilis TaxID=150966 RepID=A0AAD3SKJ9_NEPGR|nr:hypothetical protein Nepgr_014240 [Nepenthes gracilis]